MKNLISVISNIRILNLLSYEIYEILLIIYRSNVPIDLSELITLHISSLTSRTLPVSVLLSFVLRYSLSIGLHFVPF